MSGFVLTKEDVFTVYFRCKDKTGHSVSTNKVDAMIFETKDEAIDYSHEFLYGEYEAVTNN